MSQIQSRRNQSIECARLIASFFVVFIHCFFPGTFGQIVQCIGHFAVPMFFAISGYFCYQIPSGKIQARLKHIFKLYLLAELAYVLWNIFEVEYQGGSTGAYLICLIPSIEEIAMWLFMNVPPYVSTLWYLLGLMTCYVILWLYVRFFDDKKIDYRPLYIVGMILLVAHFLIGIILTEIKTDRLFFWERTGLFFGIPMFAMGIFIHEFQQRIIMNYRLTTLNLGCLIALSVILVLIQWAGGMYTKTMEFGVLIGTFGLMLLLIQHPVIVKPESIWGVLISKFGFLSTAIYVLHLMAMMAYSLLLKASVQEVFGDMEPWLKPLIVLGLSLLAAIICERLVCVGRKLRKRK